MLLFAKQYGMPGGFSGLLSQICLAGGCFLLVEDPPQAGQGAFNRCYVPSFIDAENFSR